MENQIRRSERLSALGELTASIAHEIRNPLTGIKMVAQLLEDEIINLDEQLLEHIQLQIEEVERLDRIVTEMLRFARPATPKIETCEIGKLLESIIFILKNRIAQKNIKLSLNFICDEDSVCSCDCDQIKQVLLNVIINSIDSIKGGGVIKIDVDSDSKYFRIMVKDNGCGVEEEKIRKVFNPFFTTKEKGTGLGLAIAHRIIEEHGGRIIFTSRKGEGTKVELLLPLKLNE
jgi:signal transduction histidine kinase